MLRVGQIGVRNFHRTRFQRYITTDHNSSNQTEDEKFPLNGVRILDLTRIGMVTV